MAVMSRREGLEFSLPVESDCAPLNKMVSEMLASGGEIHCLRDPTRGGLATTLNEFAQKSRVGIRIHENQIPVPEPVRAACDLLGLDFQEFEVARDRLIDMQLIAFQPYSALTPNGFHQVLPVDQPPPEWGRKIAELLVLKPVDA